MMREIHKILVVEDEAITAMTLKLKLAQAGYEISNVVATGEEAVTSVKQDFPDLVLMDIRLAGLLNGIEAAQQIQGFHPAPPIIFMTGYPDPEIQQQAQQLHPLAYFVKPVNMQELHNVITRA